MPVLIHAFPDETGKMRMGSRRDSFCGKMSVCNNLWQYGIPFTLTRLHTSDPTGESFQQDLADFAVTCRTVKALKNLRIGALGARPAAFNTVRYSEKLLEKSGISIETLDLSEVFSWVGKMADNEPAVKKKLAAINAYVSTASVPAAALLKMAKFGVGVDRWMKDKQLNANAVDLDGGVLWCRPVHVNEHDEQGPVEQRVRSGQPPPPVAVVSCRGRRIACLTTPAGKRRGRPGCPGRPSLRTTKSLLA